MKLAKRFTKKDQNTLLSNDINTFLLMWIEKEGFTTAEEISLKTGINIEKVNQVLKVLFNNELIVLDINKLNITQKGLNVLEQLGLWDMVFNNYLKIDKMKTKEVSLYKELFYSYRNLFSNEYLNNIYNRKIWITMSSKPMTLDFESNFLPKSIIIMSLFDIFNTINKSLSIDVYHLANSYLNLIKYANKNECFTSLAFKSIEDENTKFTKSFMDFYILSNKNNSYLLSTNSDSNNNKSDITMHKYRSMIYKAMNEQINLKETLFFANDSILNDNAVLNTIMNNNSINDISDELKLTTLQTKLFLNKLKGHLDNILIAE